jgi:hypothetical protein
VPVDAGTGTSILPGGGIVESSQSDVELETLRIEIAGQWSAEEMSLCLGDLSRLYAIRLTLDFDPITFRRTWRFREGPEPLWDWLPFSYGGAPLKLARIEHASPGLIEVKGLGDPIKQLRILLEKLASPRQTLRGKRLENEKTQAEIDAEKLRNAREFLQVAREAHDLGIEGADLARYLGYVVEGAQERMLRQIERGNITSIGTGEVPPSPLEPA